MFVAIQGEDSDKERKVETSDNHRATNNGVAEVATEDSSYHF